LCIFKPKFPIWVNSGGPKNGIFYVHLEYYAAIWYILWPFGDVLVIWYIFPRFGILYQEKSGNPANGDTGDRLAYFWLQLVA
jgi:hypothetical protein